MKSKTVVESDCRIADPDAGISKLASEKDLSRKIDYHLWKTTPAEITLLEYDHHVLFDAMTRITNFGRKRTYLEAGFGGGEQDIPEADNPVPGGEDHGEPNGSAAPKKKRKRTKPSMRDGNTGVKAAQAAAERAEKEALKAKALESGDLTGLSKSAKKKLRVQKAMSKPKEAPVAHFDPSERRRLKRQQDKQDTTTCFICRERGHSARECPKSEDNKGNNSLVGICYRCGSENHILSRCRKPADPENPLPFASCFVCNTKGHLASSCPQNKEKGVYPNGGCCKLCGETTHLAKDCTLRNKGEPTNNSILGTGQAAGADEDDFHLIKRQNDHMDRTERRFERKRVADFKAGPHVGGVKPGAGAPKRVVNF